jgi:hypothetical protein
VVAAAARPAHPGQLPPARPAHPGQLPQMLLISEFPPAMCSPLLPSSIERSRPPPPPPPSSYCHVLAPSALVLLASPLPPSSLPHHSFCRPSTFSRQLLSLNYCAQRVVSSLRRGVVFPTDMPCGHCIVPMAIAYMSASPFPFSHLRLPGMHVPGYEHMEPR